MKWGRWVRKARKARRHPIWSRLFSYIRKRKTWDPRMVSAIYARTYLIVRSFAINTDPLFHPGGAEKMLSSYEMRVRVLASDFLLLLANWSKMEKLRAWCE